MIQVWRVAGYLLPLALWAIGARALDLAIALPPPTTVFSETWHIIVSGSFLRAVIFTSARAIAALLASVLVAVPLGVAAARYRRVALLVGPSVTLFRAVPFISIILLAVIWFTSGTVPVFVAVLMVFPLIYQATVTGVESVDPRLQEMMRAFEVPVFGRIRHLWLPGASRSILGGIRAANGIAWKVAVAAEVLSVPPDGIGTSMGEARLYLETEGVLAWTVVLVLLAGISDFVLAYFEKRYPRDRTIGGRNTASQNSHRSPAPPVDDNIDDGIGNEIGGEILPAATPTPSITVENVTFGWENASVPLVDRLNVTFEPGTITAIIGPSGVGKTTVLHLLGGLLSPTGGRITIDTANENGPHQPPPVGFRRRIVFQEPRLLPWRSVRSNLLITGRGARVGTSGTFRSVDTGVIAWALDLVGLNRSVDLYPDQMSGGMQQRVGLARALSASPDLLLIDEPLSAVDATHREELSAVLQDILSRAGRTTILASHDLDLVYAVADRIILIEERPIRVRLDLYRTQTEQPAGVWDSASKQEIERVLAGSRYTI